MSTSTPSERVDPLAAQATRELAMALGRVHRALARAYPGPLAAGALSALATVVREGPIRVGDLARREGTQAPTLSRIAAWLDSEGYVERQTDPEDRRSAFLVATEIGHAVYDDVWSRRSRALANGIGAMPRPHQQSLLAAIPHLQELSEHIDRSRDG